MRRDRKEGPRNDSSQTLVGPSQRMNGLVLVPGIRKAGHPDVSDRLCANASDQLSSMNVRAWRQDDHEPLRQRADQVRDTQTADSNQPV